MKTGIQFFALDPRIKSGGDDSILTESALDPPPPLALLSTHASGLSWATGGTPKVTQHPTPRPAGGRRWVRFAVLALVYGALLAAGHWGSEWLIGLVGVDLGPGAPSHGRHMIAAAIALYAVLMAFPFVPGIEISLALFAVFGHQVALAIYGATVAALTTSYLVGRLLPLRLIAALFRSLGQRRAEGLVHDLEPLSPAQRLEALTARAPKRIVPSLLRHRYIAVLVALNIPGNAVIGGGGGIALLAGMSGLFTFPRFLAVVSLAVLPVPLAVLLIGG